MNLHLATDEKFIDFVINDVRILNLSGENEFYVYSKDDNPLKYVKNQVHRLIVGSAAWEKFFGERVLNYERIYIHYFDSSLYEVIQSVPRPIKIIWCFFGQDGFSFLRPYSFLQKDTRNYLKRLLWNRSFRQHGVIFLLAYPWILMRRRIFWDRQREQHKKFFQRIDYFGHFIPEDYELLKREMEADFQYLPFTFNSMEELMYDESNYNPGSDIIIGNSSVLTNNHIEIIHRLKSFRNLNKKVYCPLSYGDTEYAEVVEQRGREAFGSNFYPLRTFLPLNEYKKIVHDCGFVFMNHDRSQASDNILISVSSGAKVFMSEQSTLFHFLKSLGISIFSIQQDLKSADAFEPLSLEVRKLNKQRLRDFFGREQHIERLVHSLSV